jgi:hypothetical protein
LTAKINITKTAALLAALWLLVQAGLLYAKGITINMESQVHINTATYFLQHGHFEIPKLWFYALPSLLLALCIKTGIGYWGMVLVQLAVNAVATLCFYKMCVHLSQNRTVAFIASFLLIVFIPLQVWNTFLYTESLFISGTIIFSYLLVRSRLGAAALVGVLAGLVLLTLTRPAGVLLVAPVFLYVAQQKITGKNTLLKKALLVLPAIGALVLLLNSVFKRGGGDFDLMRPFVEEHIICFMPTAQPGQQLNLANTGQPIADLLYYILHNPAHFFKLIFLRLLSFFNLARPYYSTVHNLLLYAVMVPVYLLAITGLVKKTVMPGRFYLWVLIALYAIAISLQCDDYHSRFAMVVFPYIFYFAAAGAAGFFQKKSKQGLPQ